ncbi:g9287 [Coccomyxa elongata]
MLRSHCNQNVIFSSTLSGCSCRASTHAKASTSASNLRQLSTRHSLQQRLVCSAASAAQSTEGKGKRGKRGSSKNEQPEQSEQPDREAARKRDAASALHNKDEMEAFLREHGSGPLLEAMQEELPRWRTEDFPLDGGRNPGYTPFEYITFTDELIQHTLTVQVDAPVSKVYRIWANRLNYNEWFDLIGQMVLHTEDPEYASYFLFYKWGQLPTLELYVTLMRTLEENEYVIERAVDGMDLSVGAYFKEKDGGTEVNLRVAYLLPEQLRQYVGPVGVWGDINDILQENLEVMKEFVEEVDVDELDKVRALDKGVMDEGVSDTNQIFGLLNQQLKEEGVKPGEGSPAARAEMREMLAEWGYNPDDYASGDDEDEGDEEQLDEVAEAPKQAQQPKVAQQQVPDQARQESPAGRSTEEAPKGGRRRAAVKAAAPATKAATPERAASSGAKAGGEANAGRKKREAYKPNITKEELLAFAGKTQTEAAKAFGVSASKISKVARYYGLDWKTMGTQKS